MTPVELEPFEARYLLIRVQKDRAAWTRRFDDAVSHDAIRRRDRAAAQVTALDVIAAKLEGATGG